MMLRRHLQEFAPQLSAALPIWMLTLVPLTITLTVTESLGLSAAETSSWIIGLFGIPTLISILLTLRYRQPYLWTGHTLALILFGSLGGDVGLAELVGASMVAGAVVLVIGAVGITGWVTSFIPAPVVMGLIAGVVTPFVWRLFSGLGTDPALVGSMLAAYLLSRLLFGSKFPGIIPALAAGVVATGVMGRFGEPLPAFSLPTPMLIVPEFSIGVVAATVPVLVILMTLQTNVPSVIYLREQGYEPPERLINVLGGAGTLVGSILGPLALSVAVGAIPLIAGPGAGARNLRYRAGLAASGASALIALGATMAAPLAAFVPIELITAIAGLALLSILISALEDTVRGPLKLGPVVAFIVVLSDISLLGLGPFFWSLLLGTGFSLLLEREEWAQVHVEDG